MLVHGLIFMSGLGVLYLGAEWLVKGSASLALHYGIRPLVVGITVVALGTSMPEFVVNVFAAYTGEDSLALGNIIGSNICNIALILGMTALVIPLIVPRATLKKEYPIMMGVLLVFYAVALDGVIGRMDGILLVSGLVGFFVYLIYDARRHSQLAVKNDQGPSDDAREGRPESETTHRFFLMIGGIVLLAVGARAMVYAAVNVAEEFGIDPVIVGLTIVAIGTSLPELAASVVSALKQEADISLGNILGSNLLNVLFVVGTIALFQPLQVEQVSLDIHFPVMIAFGVVLFPLAWTKFQITRMEGGFLLAGFAGYILFLVAPYL
jgi:cation:H+ antiporter